MKVEDIRPAAAMAGQQAAMLRDIAMLLERRAEFVAVACPACGDEAHGFLYEKYGMRHLRCAACATQYISPRPSPDLLRDFYRQSANYRYFAEVIFPASEAARRERLFRPRAWLVADLARDLGLADAALIEIGAGYGLFCEELAALGGFSRIVAVEPTPDLAAICRGKGLSVIESPVEDVAPGETFDMLAAFEVIEHLFDPAGFLAACRRLVRPGGHVLLTCPNILGFETLALGRESTAVDHEHMNYFHPAALARLLERSGFDQVRITTPGRLDLDLVRRALAGGAVSRADLGPFVLHLADTEDPAAEAALQRFLHDARLSSNMQAVARRR